MATLREILEARNEIALEVPIDLEKLDCPPKAKYFDKVFDISQPIYGC